VARLRARITIDERGRIIGLGGFASIVGAHEVKKWGNKEVDLTIEDKEGKVVKKTKVKVRDSYDLIQRGKV